MVAGNALPDILTNEPLGSCMTRFFLGFHTFNALFVTLTTFILIIDLVEAYILSISALLFV